MKNYKYKEHFTQKQSGCFVSDSFEALLEAAASLNLKDRRVLLVSERQYGGFYLDQVSKAFGAGSRSFDVFEIPENLTDCQLIAARVHETAQSIGLEKTDVLASLGGILADAAARVYAAEYCPEIPYIRIPVTFVTQLLSTAASDAILDYDFDQSPAAIVLTEAAVTLDVRSCMHSIQPAVNYIDILAYKNLSETDRISGIGLALVLAACADASLFHYLEDTTGKKANDFFSYLMNMILNCLELNHKTNGQAFQYGETIARALEQCTNFIIPHGQAIGVGSVVANNIAVKRGLLSEKDSFRLAKTMAAYGLSILMNFTNDLIDAICAQIPADESGRLEGFAVIDRIGHSLVLEDVTLDEIRTAMNYRR